MTKATLRDIVSWWDALPVHTRPLDHTGSEPGAISRARDHVAAGEPVLTRNARTLDPRALSAITAVLMAAYAITYACMSKRGPLRPVASASRPSQVLTPALLGEPLTEGTVVRVAVQTAFGNSVSAVGAEVHSAADVFVRRLPPPFDEWLDERPLRTRRRQ